MREIELRLLQENPRYRTIWVQYSIYRGLNIVITLFPVVSTGIRPYTMVFGLVQDLSYESINNILQANLVD